VPVGSLPTSSSPGPAPVFPAMPFDADRERRLDEAANARLRDGGTGITGSSGRLHMQVSMKAVMRHPDAHALLSSPDGTAEIRSMCQSAGVIPRQTLPGRKNRFGRPSFSRVYR